MEYTQALDKHMHRINMSLRYTSMGSTWAQDQHGINTGTGSTQDQHRHGINMEMEYTWAQDKQVDGIYPGNG